MPTRVPSLLPRSLVGRVFALYAMALLLFVGSGLGLFFRYQFALQLDIAQQRAESLVQVAAPTMFDSAVIGDYDTIRRVLERAVHQSDFASASFIDLKGGALTITNQEKPATNPPAWLRKAVEDRLYDSNLPINVGGNDYGVLRVSFAADRIAGELWNQALYALALGAVGLAGGLVLLRVPLGYWLGDFRRMRAFEEGMRSGTPAAGHTLGEHAPLEFKRTFDVLNRTAASLQQLDAIFAVSPDGFISFDEQRRVNYASPGFTRLTGLPAAAVMALPEAQFGELLAERCSSGAELLRSFDALREEHEDEHHRHSVELSRPTRRVLDVGLRQSGSAGISQLLHLRDVTHETEVEQMKSEFLSTAAHELRTPMASIYGFSELLMSGRLQPKRQTEALATIHRQTELMISIVNELLDLARIEARRGKDFRLEDLDLRTLAEQVLHDFKTPEGRSAATFDAPDEPVPVRVDRLKMAQALGNVVSNAFKYSPGGGSVAVRVVTRGAQAGLEVRDEGIGMTPEQLARVCQRFYRADASGVIPGTGLGMSIVKEIVELLGGSLALESEPERGTAVTLWLPMARRDAAAAQVPEAAEA